MTYPPQPGQPGQPDPYNQGQGGQQYPQSGGYPQQQYPQTGGQQYQQGGQQYPPTAGYPQQDPNAAWQGQQQYGGYDPNAGYQYQQGFGGPPAPPKGRTGMWIAIAVAVVVVLGALGVTGFVAPGFFLSKGGNSDSPDGLAQAVANAVKNNDSKALSALLCNDADSDLKDLSGQLNDTGGNDKVTNAEVKGSPTKVSDTEYTAVLHVTGSKPQQVVDLKGTMDKENGKWCLKSVALPDLDSPGGGSHSTAVPHSTSPETTSSTSDTYSSGGSDSSDAGKGPATDEANKFLDAVNGGNKSGALALTCPDFSDNSYLDDAVSGSPQIKAGTVDGGYGSYTVDLTGSYKGGSANGIITVSNADKSNICVEAFIVYGD